MQYVKQNLPCGKRQIQFNLAYYLFVSISLDSSSLFACFFVYLNVDNHSITFCSIVLYRFTAKTFFAGTGWAPNLVGAPPSLCHPARNFSSGRHPGNIPSKALNMLLGTHLDRVVKIPSFWIKFQSNAMKLAITWLPIRSSGTNRHHPPNN